MTISLMFNLLVNLSIPGNTICCSSYHSLSPFLALFHILISMRVFNKIPSFSYPYPEKAHVPCIALQMGFVCLYLPSFIDWIIYQIPQHSRRLQGIRYGHHWVVKTPHAQASSIDTEKQKKLGISFKCKWQNTSLGSVGYAVHSRCTEV